MIEHMAAMPGCSRRSDVVVIGTSLGSFRALTVLLAGLPADFPLPLLVVRHRQPSPVTDTAALLQARTALHVKEAAAGEVPRAGVVYLAPANRHLVLARRGVLALNAEQREQFVRPSADVLFRSVAERQPGRAIAVILTGSGRDGAAGAQAIKRSGGLVIAQNRPTCAAFGMPGAAIAAGCVDFVLPLRVIAAALVTLTMVPGADDLFIPHGQAA